MAKRTHLPLEKMSKLSLILAFIACAQVSSFVQSVFPSAVHTKSTALASTTAEPSTAATPTKLGVTIGDTRGATLLLENLHISTGGGTQILKNINFRVDRQERWGIVGPNGCGEVLEKQLCSMIPLLSLSNVRLTSNHRQVNSSGCHHWNCTHR